MLATARLPGPNAEGCTEEDTIPPWQDCALGSAAAGATAIPTPIAPAATATTSFLVRFTNSPPFRGSSPRTILSHRASTAGVMFLTAQKREIRCPHFRTDGSRDAGRGSCRFEASAIEHWRRSVSAEQARVPRPRRRALVAPGLPVVAPASLQARRCGPPASSTPRRTRSGTRSPRCCSTKAAA
jgi:hypothetical protein